MGVERAMPWEKNRRWKEPGYLFSFVMIASFLFFLSSLGLWFFRFFFLFTVFLFSFSHRYTRFQNYACCGSTLLNYSLRVKDCKRYFTSVKIVTYIYLCYYQVKIKGRETGRKHVGIQVEASDSLKQVKKAIIFTYPRRG